MEVSENIKTLYIWALKENRRFLIFKSHNNTYRICGLYRDINMEEGQEDMQGPNFVTLKPMPPIYHE